jgi:acetyl-CoA carboxylase carboxyltransferase component
MKMRVIFFDELAKQIGQEKADKDIKHIYWAKAPEVPGYTFFIGKKQGKAAIVLYPRAIMENGIPRAVIYILGAEDLHSILHEFFLKQWNKAIKHAANKALPSGKPAP